VIQLNELEKYYGSQVLFKGLSLTLARGEKLGLVGKNGSGKSTLFRLILRQEIPDGGQVSVPKNYHIATLEQHIKFTENTVIEECSQALREDEKYDQYKVEKILFGLGFSENDLYLAPKTFSGGYQIRMNLAKVLVQNPNLLLLDEPTNYLDIVSLRWLKNFLRAFKGEFIIITHDREFMDDVATHIVGLTRKKLKKIKGNTLKFYEQLAEEDEIYEKTKLNHDKKLKQMQAFVDKFRASASRGSQAQSRLKAMEKMGTMGSLGSDKNLNFKFNHIECPGKFIMEVKNISFSYDKTKPLVENLKFSIGRRDRIAIIGKNGKGKSTLLNLLAAELIPDTGNITNHPSMKKGHFGQTNIARLCEANTVEQEILECNPNLTYHQTRSICGTMMFEGDAAEKKVSVLSGGERSRVLLGKILAHPANLLLLDEPTNHLDQESVHALLQELVNYEGAVVIVTHSEMILKALAEKLVIFHHGIAEYFEGGYEDFLNKIGWEEEGDIRNTDKRKLEPGERGARKLSKKEKNKKRTEILNERARLTKPLKKEMEKIEHDISILEKTLKTKNHELIEASKNNNGKKIKELSRLVANLENEIEDQFTHLENSNSQHDSCVEEFNILLLELE